MISVFSSLVPRATNVESSKMAMQLMFRLRVRFGCAHALSRMSSISMHVMDHDSDSGIEAEKAEKKKVKTDHPEDDKSVAADESEPEDQDDDGGEDSSEEPQQKEDDKQSPAPKTPKSRQCSVAASHSHNCLS